MTGKYIVSNIYEDDFGCEERSEDHEPQVIVVLRAPDGSETVLKQSDAWMYEQDIREGTEVVLMDGKLKK